MTDSYYKNFEKQAVMKTAKDPYTKEGYSDLNLLTLWAEEKEEDFMRRYRISVDLLKTIVQDFRRTK